MTDFVYIGIAKLYIRQRRIFALAPPGLLGADAFEHSVNTSMTRDLVVGCHGLWLDVPLSWETLK